MIKKGITVMFATVILFILFISCVQILFHIFPYFEAFKTKNSVVKEILAFSWNDFIINLITSLIIFLFIFIITSVFILALSSFKLFDFKTTNWLVKCSSLLCTASAIVLSIVLSFNGEQFSLLATLFSSFVFLKPVFNNLRPDGSKSQS